MWFTAYPSSIIIRDGQSVLATLGDEALWRTLAGIGIQALHKEPLKQAGGLRVKLDGHAGKSYLIR